jgi:hypothetical protein
MTTSRAFDEKVSEFPRHTQPRLRASDADRVATARTLQDAVGHGLLTYDEAGERIAAAYGARFRDELPPLTADLPPVTAADPGPPGWRRLSSQFAEQLRHEARATKAAGLRSRRAAVAAVLALLLTAMVFGLGGFLFGGYDEHEYEHPYGTHQMHDDDVEQP